MKDKSSLIDNCQIQTKNFKSLSGNNRFFTFGCSKWSKINKSALPFIASKADAKVRFRTKTKLRSDLTFYAINRDKNRKKIIVSVKPGK